MEAVLNMMIGVFTGVITTVLLYLTKLIIDKILLPWYQNLTYRGIDVSGVWEGEFSSSDTANFTAKLTLDQSAHNLSGSYIVIKYINGEEQKITSMSVSGEVWEGFVSLKCRTISNKNLSFGSMLLKINDSELNGHKVFRNLAGNGSGIVNRPIILKRTEGNA
ncbi:hypothetical protein [Pseudomonas sp. ML96]|uniref:hypothetical protein n=1 Tax=Pseudomonas sp. ML96 TaxID=1523503 RepID=UPI0012E0053C|nr:hypothetical protein [Pseudomonas sp. ML96]